ncbi:hydroxymethylglutaryl-coenzyme A reductase-domain-containing protein [Mycena amicta]|nr:hydroxymethylglutaryl-coenzyme A reductase-domain-containing protein [Mycena amicta]
MRTLLKPLAIHAAYSPIETIVFLSCVGTLAYLHILSASVWLRDELVPRLDLQQIVFAGHRLERPSLENVTKHISTTYPGFSHLRTSQDSWTQTIQLNSEFSSRSLPPDSWGIAYEVQAPEEAIAQMQSGRWFAYALKVLVLRFYDLAKKTPTPDILIILSGYLFMHFTFYLLWARSRALGSSFSLPIAIISSSVLALLLAVPAAMLLHIPMHPVALTEALPFLVCTVGFDKPLRLARAVFTHPRALRPASTPAGEVVLDGLSATYYPIVRDYILEIAVLVIGASSRVAGLSEVCALAALLLALDCLMVCTFLAAILCVMIEVRRLPPPVAAKPSMWSRVGGPKGTLLPPRGSLAGSHPSKPTTTPESPVARLKLLLLVAFLGLHVLNFSAPFALPPPPPRPSTLPAHTTPLDWDILARLTPPPLSEAVSGPRLLVRLRPPITLRPARNTRLFTIPVGAGIETALSAWTRLVGDPVLSKGIVAVLAISVLLNAYLIRGVARAGAVRGGAVRFDGEVKDETGATQVNKLKDEPLKEAEQDGWAKDVAATSAAAIGEASTEKLVPISIVHAQTPAPTAGAVPTFSLEDVDRRLRERGRTTRSRTPARRVHFFFFQSIILSCIQVIVGDEEDEDSPDSDFDDEEREPRPLPELIALLANSPKSDGLRVMNDEELVLLAQNGKIAPYALEKVLAPAQEPAGLERAVRVRRALISRASLTQTLESSDIPFESYDYGKVLGACCENVVGYIPLPLGIAGPLTIDGVSFHIPMATAEGTLVASTSRGCKALNAGGGVTTVLTQDAMTRGPAIDFPSIVEAARAKAWVASPEGHGALKTAFESTSRFARLTGLKTAIAGRTLFVRFATATGDAMGMNMISKGTEKALEVMQAEFPEMIVLALSGNYCTDKKPAAINWIEGRGKSVVAEAVVPGKVVKSVLKTTVEALCNLNIKKNLIGSAMAGSIGGFNAHAANILTAIFIATGQDPAQNVESSNCMTLMEPTNDGQDLLITVSMPCIEVGTVGGGTVLTPQGAVLEMLGLRGAHPTRPGQNAQGLARVIASAVMAGELSLMSALAAGHLIRAHMVHNRSAPSTPVVSRPATPGIESPVAGQLSGAKPAALTPSSSTASLPPYSRT